MQKVVRKLGLLRVFLLALALCSAISMFWVDLDLTPYGWGLLRAAILPALAPIVFMVLLLDFLMCQVLKADAETDVKRRQELVLIGRLDLLAAMVLLLSWLPVFLRATFF